VAPSGRHWPISLLVIAAIVTAAIGVGLGSAAGTAGAASTASRLVAEGAYAKAVAVDEAIAGRSGPLFLVDPGAAGAASGAAERTLMAWAASLGRKGDVDAAVALYRSVTAPSLRRAALDALAALLLNTASAEAAAGQYPNAILRLLEIGTLAPKTRGGVLAAQQLPVDQAGEARLLITAGRAVDAVAILNAVVREHSRQATRTALSLYPSALLAAGEEALADDSYREALNFLEQLVTTYPSSAEASQAEAMLAAPQTVSGTLVTHIGASVSGRVRLSSNYKAEPGGRYQTSAPFYYTTADAAGDFSFSNVPIGGPYVLEVFSAGNWSTLINPSTDQPASPVTVTRLVPIDLTLVVLPS
jgi:tetratricopeptide (TPR) repeat protein